MPGAVTIGDNAPADKIRTIQTTTFDRYFKNVHKTLSLILLGLLLGGCSMLTDRFAENLGNAILNQDDPETVKAGAPTFLILIDSLLIDSPDDPGLLRASATLNGTYATVFVQDEERAKKLSDKARGHSRQAMCHDFPGICDHEKGPIDEFVAELKKVDRRDIDTLYTYGSAWAGWIQTHSKDWNAVADLSRVEAVMERIVAINEKYEWGRAHLFLGVIKSQLPPALGGKPEEGRRHFERAIEISKGRDLVAKVEFARNYARLMFDQDLHDRLLKEVLTADPVYNGLTLSNVLAQKQARELFATSKDYFED